MFPYLQFTNSRHVLHWYTHVRHTVILHILHVTNAYLSVWYSHLSTINVTVLKRGASVSKSRCHAADMIMFVSNLLSNVDDREDDVAAIITRQCPLDSNTFSVPQLSHKPYSEDTVRPGTRGAASCIGRCGRDSGG